MQNGVYPYRQYLYTVLSYSGIKVGGGAVFLSVILLFLLTYTRACNIIKKVKIFKKATFWRCFA